MLDVFNKVKLFLKFSLATLKSDCVFRISQNNWQSQYESGNFNVKLNVLNFYETQCNQFL